MDREVDETMLELAKTTARLEELAHQLEVDGEWNTILYTALQMVCERSLAASDPNFFDLDEETRKSKVHDLMMSYTLKAKEGEYEPRHKRSGQA